MARPAPGGASPSGASLLERVGQRFLDAASSLDANIDAGALVDRLAGADPGSEVAVKAIAELKELSRRAPVAVVATPGALPAVFRVVNRLSQHCGQDAELDHTEALQDGLETLGVLLGEIRGAGRAAGAAAEDPGAERRSREVAEHALRHTQNGKDLLRLLSANDVSTQYDAMVVLQRIYHRIPDPINNALLADPMSLNRLMNILQNSHIDYVRNEALSFLLLLTEANAELQQIVTMQELPETVFAMLKEEGLGTGGKIARDLIRCLANLAGNTTCQRCIRETGGLGALVAAVADALAGTRPGGAEDEEEDDDIVGQRMEVPEEARWACFLMLADVALVFVGAGGSSNGSVGRQGEPHPEVDANRETLVRHGALDLLRHLPDAKPSLDVRLRLVWLLEALEASPLAASQLEAVDRRGGIARPSVLPSLTSILVGTSAPLPLRSALGRALCRTIARHAPLQLALFTSLSPEIEPEESDEGPQMGRLLVGLLEKAALDRVEPEQLWFAFHLLLAMILGNPSVQGALPTMRVAFSGGGEPAELFLDLLLMAFSGCARKCLEVLPDDDAAQAAAPQGPHAPAAALVAALKLLVCWIACCPAALDAFAGSAVMVPRAMELVALGNKCGPFYRVQVEGLAALLMGICISATTGAVADAASLMRLVASGVGIEEFQNKMERLFRSEVLQRPPRQRGAFRWHNNKFRAFVRQQQQAIQRRMIELYVSEGIGRGGGALSEDVADQYKQLIRVQDEKFREVQKENEQLRAEVEAFMRRSLQASSVTLLEKMDALTKENDALHAEVAQLEQECRESSQRTGRELRQCRAYICELEEQRESMAVGYEQVERTSEELRREAKETRAALAAVERLRQGSADELTLATAAATAQQQVEELSAEKADLLELLRRIVAACPEASRFVAPLALPLGSAPAAPAEGRGSPTAAAPA